MGVPDWMPEDIGEVPEEWPWRQTSGQGHRRATSVSQHIPTAVTSPHGAPGGPTTASHRGLRESTTQRHLKAHYVGRKGPILFCTREVESSPPT